MAAKSASRPGIVRAAFDRLGVVALIVAAVLLFVPSIATEAQQDYSPRTAPPWFWTRVKHAVTPDLFGVVCALAVIAIYVFSITPIRQRNEARVEVDDHERRRAEDRERPMDESHASWLRAIALALVGSIGQDSLARYGDAHQTAAFRRHFPEFVPLLDEWDQLPVRIDTARRAALSSISASSHSPWAEWYVGDAVVEYARSYIGQFVRTADPPPAAFAVIDHGEERGLVLVQGNQSGGKILRQIPPPLSNADRAEAEEQVRQLKAWTAQLHGSALVVAWREALDRQDALRAELVRRLQAVQHATTLDRNRCGPGCEPL